MSRARRLCLELGLIACVAGALMAALVALAVGSLEPSLAAPAFLQAFTIFAGLVFAAALLIEALVPAPELGGLQ